MSILNNSLLLKKAAAASAPAEDPVTRSLRFDATDDLYKATGSTNTTWTVSMWVKRSKLSSRQYFFSWGGDGINFDANDKISIWNGASYATSTAVFRDVSSWYHLTISCNAGTITVYVNGVSQTMSSSPSYPAWGNVYFGRWSGNTSYKFSGYLADIYGIESSALDHTSFTESNDFSGLRPKAYTGSFGTKGFHIDAQPAHDADLLVSSIDRNDGDTDVADAAQGHGLTVYGSTDHSVAAGNPFTGDDRAMYFNGSSALTIPDSTDWEPSGDFTYEAWIMPTWSSAPTYSFPFGHGSSDGQDVNMGHGVLLKNGTLYLTGWFGSTYHHPNYSSSGSGFAVSADEWTHVAIVRDGNTIRYYKNGAQESTFTVSGSATAESNVFALGRSGGLTNYTYTGYIADFRITHDAEYPSGTTFTTPTAPHSTTSDTKVRIQPQSSDTTWDDEEGNHTISTVGSPARTASTPYDAAAKSTAIHFDGNADYIKVWDGSSGDYVFGTNDYTIECWINLPELNSATYYNIFSVGAVQMRMFCYGNRLQYYTLGSSSSYLYNSSYPLSTDTWYHIAIVRDGSNYRLYINGKLYDSGTGTGTEQALTSSSPFNIGTLTGYTTTQNYNGYIYDFRVTGGEAKYSGTSTASDWANFDEISAPFELTPVYIGGDQSGNKNHFQANISGHDVMLDVPYPKNYATLNTVSDVVTSGYANTFSNGNLTLSPSHADNKAASTIAVSSGKWYAEVRYDSDGNQMAGIGRVDCLENTSNYIGQSSSAFGYVIYRPTGDMYHNGSTTDIFSALSSGDILQIALDLDSNTVWWGLNGTWVGTVGSSGGTSITAAEYYFVQTYRNPCTWNFGQDNTFAGQFTGTPNNAEFAYAIPTDFKSLNTSNLDAPTVTPAENFNTVLWAGSGSQDNDISGVGFQPNFTWVKNRTASREHALHDSVRGAGKELRSNSTNTESDQSTMFGPFQSDGFRVAESSVGGAYNDSGNNYVAWNWKAHQSPASSDARTTYTVRLESNNGNGWDYSYYYDSSTGLPSCYMEIFENRSGGLQSLTGGKVAVRTYSDGNGTTMADTSSQDYTLKCVDINAITVKWYYDTQYDSDSNYYTADDGMGAAANGLLNEQKITMFSDSSSYASPDFTANSYSNDSGNVYTGYSPSSPWGNEDSLKAASTSYTGTDTATIVSGSGSSGPTEKYNGAARFTIISYAGDGFSDGDSQTLDHSLEVPLDFVIAKPRTNNQSMGGNWVVWHKDLSDYEYLLLNSPSAKKTDSSSNEVIATAVSGTQHQVVVNNGYDGSNYHYLNMGPYSGTAGEDYILYGWAGVEGYSKFGKVTGNGNSSDGVFCYLGFRPALIIMKNITHSSGYHWRMWDSARGSHNVNDEVIYPSSSLNETTSDGHIDFLSNGFKLRSSAGNLASDYIYAAWAESPFSKSNAR